MKSTACFIGGIGLGAGLMCLLDPQQGKRRRALIRDQGVRLAHEAEDAARVVARDISHRACGLAAEAKALFRHGDVSDDVLEQRIRSKMGRYVSHPRAIDIRCQDGRAILSGHILACDVDGLLRCVASIPGIKGIEQSLDIHKAAGTIADLQGGRQIDALQERWSPTTRFLAGSAGLGLTVYGLTKEAPAACVLGTVGLGLIARSLVNVGVRHWIDVNSIQQAVGDIKDNLPAKETVKEVVRQVGEKVLS
jgi:hypothetical protein